jgi:hypothetical protein
MGRPRKKLSDMPTSEVVKKLFPPEAVREAKKAANPKGNAPHGKDTT